MYDSGAEGEKPEAGAPEIEIPPEAFARAIYDALGYADHDAFFGDFSLEERVTIDGSFNLREAAEHLRMILKSYRA